MVIKVSDIRFSGNGRPKLCPVPACHFNFAHQCLSPAWQRAMTVGKAYAGKQSKIAKNFLNTSGNWNYKKK